MELFSVSPCTPTLSPWWVYVVPDQVELFLEASSGLVIVLRTLCPEVHLFRRRRSALP